MTTKVWKQSDIFTYLESNPAGANVHVGSLEDMNNQDYIFFDYIDDILIGSDNNGSYKTKVQFTIATKDFDTRKLLTDYIKAQFPSVIAYQSGEEYEYYVAKAICDLFIVSESETV